MLTLDDVKKQGGELLITHDYDDLNFPPQYDETLIPHLPPGDQHPNFTYKASFPKIRERHIYRFMNKLHKTPFLPFHTALT